MEKCRAWRPSNRCERAEFFTRFVEKVIFKSQPLMMCLDDWDPRAWPKEAPVPIRALPGPGFSRRQCQRVRARPKERRARAILRCTTQPDPFRSARIVSVAWSSRFPVTQVLFEDHVGSLKVQHHSVLSAKRRASLRLVNPGSERAFDRTHVIDPRNCSGPLNRRYLARIRRSCACRFLETRLKWYQE